MRHLDLSPLYRSTVGFDRIGSMIDQLLAGDAPAPTYPPYNIEKTGEDAYRISLAVAGFGESDLSIEVKDQGLTVTAKKQETAEEKGKTFLYRGIAERGFERRFQLADHMRVTGARLENGLLHVELVREIPEALKPRTIAITSNGRKPQTIEA